MISGLVIPGFRSLRSLHPGLYSAAGYAGSLSLQTQEFETQELRPERMGTAQLLDIDTVVTKHQLGQRQTRNTP